MCSLPDDASKLPPLDDSLRVQGHLCQAPAALLGVHRGEEREEAHCGWAVPAMPRQGLLDGHATCLSKSGTGEKSISLVGLAAADAQDPLGRWRCRREDQENT